MAATLKVIHRLQAFSNAIRRTFVQYFTIHVVLETVVSPSRSREHSRPIFMRSWSWEARSWYLWSWSWRVGLEKFQDQLCMSLCNIAFGNFYISRIGVFITKCHCQEHPLQWAVQVSTSLCDLDVLRSSNLRPMVVSSCAPHRARMTDDVLCELVFVKCNAAL